VAHDAIRLPRFAPAVAYASSNYPNSYIDTTRTNAVSKLYNVSDDIAVIIDEQVRESTCSYLLQLPVNKSLYIDRHGSLAKVRLTTIEGGRELSNSHIDELGSLLQVARLDAQ
jgi:hypothetical protein